PPPAKAACGGAGMIIMLVVAVVVTVLTKGATAKFFSTLFSSSPAWAAAATAATAAVAGSVASQAVGLAIGVIDEFDFKAVAKSGLMAGVTAGVGELGFGGDMASFMGADASSWAYQAIAAATNSALSQGLLSAVGAGSFSWRNVAAAGIAAPVVGAIGKSDWAASMVAAGRGFDVNFAGSLSANLVHVAVQGKGKVDFAAVAANAFGDALGNSIAANMQSGPTAAQQYALENGAGPLNAATAEQYAALEQFQAYQAGMGFYASYLSGREAQWNAWFADSGTAIAPSAPMAGSLAVVGSGRGVNYKTSARTHEPIGNGVRVDSTSDEREMDRHRPISMFVEGFKPRDTKKAFLISLQMSANEARVSKNAHVESKVLPEVEALYPPFRSLAGDAARSAFAEALDSSNGGFTRLGHTALGIMASPLAVANDLATSIFNAPNVLYTGGQRFAQYAAGGDTDVLSDGLLRTGLGILDLAGAAAVTPKPRFSFAPRTPVSTVVDDAMLPDNFMLENYHPVAVSDGAVGNLANATNLERQAALQRMAEALRYRALGWNHEQGKFSMIETMAISRAESAYGKRFLPSNIEGVDVIDPNGWGNVSLKGPFLNKNQKPLTIDQQMRAVNSIQKHVQQNTAVNTHVIDTMGLSGDVLKAMQNALGNAKVRIVYVGGN
ncbi:hypothetical protein, partial [Chitinimonas sp. JJ19]|uniref:hypothetical protein n=1 Tax=Chitinimonas sp. JJ19 TaxID=3109352 RepID=UPI003001877E